MTALLLALLAAVMEAGAGLALWAVGMSALPVAIVLHGLASLLAAGGLARRTRPDDVFAYFRKVLGARVSADADLPAEHHTVPPLNPISDEPY